MYILCTLHSQVYVREGVVYSMLTTTLWAHNITINIFSNGFDEGISILNLDWLEKNDVNFFKL